MSSKKIYLVRHGQTDYNLQGIVQGSGVDSSLNEMAGVRLLRFTGNTMPSGLTQCTPRRLKRTRESVAQFIERGIPHRSFTGLNEISWGNKEGQKITPEEDAYYHWMLSQWRLGNTGERIEAGENPEEVAARQKPVIDYIMSQKDEETILICMHGRAIRILLCQLLHYPLKSMDMFEHENLCLYLLNYTGSMFTVEKYCDVRHLEGLKDIPEAQPAFNVKF